MACGDLGRRPASLLKNRNDLDSGLWVRLRQKDYSEVKASLDYIVIFWASLGYSETLSQKQTKHCEF